MFSTPGFEFFFLIYCISQIGHLKNIFVLNLKLQTFTVKITEVARQEKSAIENLF